VRLQLDLTLVAMRPVATFVVVAAVGVAAVAASIYDCWDDDKLKRMTFRHTQGKTTSQQANVDKIQRDLPKDARNEHK